MMTNLASGENDRISHEFSRKRTTKFLGRNEIVEKIRRRTGSLPEFQFLESRKDVFSVIDGVGGVIVVINDSKNECL